MFTFTLDADLTIRVTNGQHSQGCSLWASESVWAREGLRPNTKKSILVYLNYPNKNTAWIKIPYCSICSLMLCSFWFEIIPFLFNLLPFLPKILNWLLSFLHSFFFDEILFLKVRENVPLRHNVFPFNCTYSFLLEV